MQYIYCFLQYQLLKVQKRINQDEYCYHVKQFILVSANSYCNFHVIFKYYTLDFHCELPHCIFHVSLSFLLIALENRCCPFSDSSLFRKRSIIGQLNVQAESEEQYTLSNIIYIAFQNCYSFL